VIRKHTTNLVILQLCRQLLPFAVPDSNQVVITPYPHAPAVVQTYCCRMDLHCLAHEGNTGKSDGRNRRRNAANTAHYIRCSPNFDGLVVGAGPQKREGVTLQQQVAHAELMLLTERDLIKFVGSCWTCTCNVTLRAKVSLQSLMLQSLPELQQLHEWHDTLTFPLIRLQLPAVVCMQLQRKYST
jgi:hypothetical protein